MSSLEIIGVVLSLLGVYFTGTKNIIAWYFNIFASLVYGYVFYRANLYADAELQVFFVGSSIYGIIHWKNAGKNWQVGSSSKLSIGIGLLLTILSGVIIGSLHQAITQNVSLPYADGLLTAGSIWATYLAAQQKKESWICWIIIDSLYVFMYLYKDLYLTAGLYGIFVVMAWKGLLKWKVES